MRNALRPIIASVPLLMAIPANAAQTPQIGSAVAVVNQVSAEYQRDLRTLQKGDRVHEDEVVEVGENSRGEIILDDNTKLALGPQSRLLLDRFVYKGERSKGDIVVNLAKGTFRFVTGAATKPSYRIRTPVASIAVRGTIFDTYVCDNGWMWLLLIEGAVRACNEQGDCRALNRPGQILLVSDQGVMSQPTRWTSLPNRDQVPFDTAVPFVGDAPGIDPNPILTREAILTGPPPVPPRTPPPKGGRKTEETKSRPTKEAQKPPRRKTRQVEADDDDDGPPVQFSFGFGRFGGGGKNRGSNYPSRSVPTRTPSGRY